MIDGNAGNYYEATAGINYRPHPNVVFRPELRIDWFDGGTPVGGSTGQAPTSSSQVASTVS